MLLLLQGCVWQGIGGESRPLPSSPMPQSAATCAAHTHVPHVMHEAWTHAPHTAKTVLLAPWLCPFPLQLPLQPLNPSSIDQLDRSALPIYTEGNCLCMRMVHSNN